MTDILFLVPVNYSFLVAEEKGLLACRFSQKNLVSSMHVVVGEFNVCFWFTLLPSMHSVRLNTELDLLISSF